MNTTPNPALVKNPSAHPGSRPPGSPEDNTPILWEVEETKLDPAGALGPHLGFENVKMLISLLSIQRPSVLVLVGITKLFIAMVRGRPSP